MELTIENLTSFIKWSFIELATNHHLDHRGYCHRDKKVKSLLAQKIKEQDNDFERGIFSVCEEILSNENIMDSFRELQQQKEKEKEKENNNEEEDDDDDGDEFYYMKDDFFYKILFFVGLYEIKALDGHFQDLFKDVFDQCIFNE
jgi:hypothetical protein